VAIPDAVLDLTKPQHRKRLPAELPKLLTFWFLSGALNTATYWFKLGGAFAHPPTNDANSNLDLGRANISSEGSLCSRHFPRRSDRQLQHLAQRRQILVTGPAIIRFPKVNARRADANLFSNFSDRQMTLDPCVA
jgi:hypothetical protein